MSRRQLKTDDEMGFLMAIYDDLKENELLFKSSCVIELRPTAKRGHFEWIVSAYKATGEGGEPLMLTTRTPYPSVTANRLYASLYRAVISIGGVQAREWHPDESERG